MLCTALKVCQKQTRDVYIIHTIKLYSNSTPHCIVVSTPIFVYTILKIAEVQVMDCILMSCSDLLLHDSTSLLLYPCSAV